MRSLAWLTPNKVYGGFYLAFLVFMYQLPQRESWGQWIDDHEGTVVGIVIGLILLCKILAGLGRWAEEQNRRDFYRAWVQRQRWKYNPNEDRQLYEEYRFLVCIPGFASHLSRNKRYPCGIHTVRGKWKQFEAVAYTQYSVSSSRRSRGGRTRSSTYRSYSAVTILKTPQSFPKLYIRPQYWYERFFRPSSIPYARLMPHQEFSGDDSRRHRERKFWARTQNPDFSEAFLHEDMKELLAKLPPKTSFEIDRDVLVLYRQGRQDLKNIHHNVGYLEEIYELIPEKLKQ